MAGAAGADVGHRSARAGLLGAAGGDRFHRGSRRCTEPSVRGVCGAVPAVDARRAGVLLPPALWDGRRRGAGTGLRSSGWPPGRRCGAGVDRRARRAAVSGLVVSGALRRVRRLVRRRRLRQVRDQRRARGLAAAGHLGSAAPARRRRRTGGSAEALLVEECRWQLDWLLRMQVPRGPPLAGLAFHRVHGTKWSPLPVLAARWTRPRACCTARRPAPPCTWPPPRHRSAQCSARRPAVRTAAARRRRRRPTGRHAPSRD